MIERIKSLLVQYPNDFIVETTNLCNLQCVGCDNKIMKRARGKMPFEYFKTKVLPQLKGIGVRHITFSLGGEPLLNEDTLKMVKLARESGMTTFFSTNGTFIDKYLDEIFDSAPDEMLISFDGVTKEIYLKFRIGGDFTRVKNNIEVLCKEKKKREARKPKITLNFLVTKFNEHQIGAFKDWAKIADNAIIKTLHWVLREPNDVLNILPKNREYIRREEILACDWASRKGVILWNGDVGLCCTDIKGEYTFGSLNNHSLKEILNSGEYAERNKKITNRNFVLCRACLKKCFKGAIK